MRLLPLPAFSTVAASTTASLVTQKADNHSLYAIHFLMGGGNNAANMDRIQIRYNDKDIINLLSHPTGPVAAGTMLDMWNAYRTGLAASAGYLSFYFGNPEFTDPKEAHAGDLDCSIHKADGGKAANLEIQVDLGAGVAPTLSAWAEVYAPKARWGMSVADCLRHKLYTRTFLQPSSALPRQEVAIANGAKSGASVLNQFWHNTNLTSLEVDKDGKQIWQDLPTALAAYFESRYGHTTAGGMYVYSPTYKKSLLDMVNTVKSDGNLSLLEHLVTTSAADSITVMSELIGNQYGTN